MMAKITVCFFLVTLSVVGQSKKELLSQLKEKENQINSLKIENEKLTGLNDKLRIIHVNQLEAVKSELLKLVLSLEESKKSIETHDISENTKDKLTDSYVSPSQSSSINSSSPSSTYSPPANSYNSRSSSSNRTIHTGPRGGRYYINSNGNKTYVKKK